MLIDSLAITRILSVFGLFIITAIAEILGCYFPYLILKEGKTAWLWLPTVLSLAIFVWFLTLSSSFWAHLCGLWRYLYFTALMWLRFVDQVGLTRWDILGGLIVLCGAGLIILQPQGLIR